MCELQTKNDQRSDHRVPKTLQINLNLYAIELFNKTSAWHFENCARFINLYRLNVDRRSFSAFPTHESMIVIEKGVPAVVTRNASQPHQTGPMSDAMGHGHHNSTKIYVRRGGTLILQPHTLRSLPNVVLSYCVRTRRRLFSMVVPRREKMVEQIVAKEIPGIEGLSPPLQFAVLACGVFFFFGVHNLLQEAMMNVPGFNFGVMLGYMEVFG